MIPGPYWVGVMLVAMTSVTTIAILALLGRLVPWAIRECVLLLRQTRNPSRRAGVEAIRQSNA